jgi:hypothetical protein
MPTWRAFNREIFNCGLYEAQDVLAEIDGVDLLVLKPARGLRIKEKWQRVLLYKDPSDTLMFANPGLHPIRVDRDYEAFVVFCQSYWDLLYVNAVKGWQDRCRTSVCWIDEIWAASVPRYKNWLKALRSFEHVCVGSKKSARVLSEAIGRACHWVPGGVDALRFSPYPVPPQRVVDVYSVGRRWDGIHAALLELASRKQIFYVHDTLQDVTSMRPINDQQHRELYANVAKRSRYFVVAPAKMNVPDHTEGESEVGYRYFEGVASGAVMIGQAPNCEHYEELFGWPDALVPIRPDGSDLSHVLASLDAMPARTAEIGRRNAAEGLLRHDWVHRWRTIWSIAGISPSAGMIAREHRLAELAAQALGRARELQPMGG